MKETMSFQEKRIITTMVSIALSFGIYFWVISGMYQDGYFEGPDSLSLIGKSILILIVGTIVATIGLIILTTIFMSVKEKPEFLSDERDKLIELKGKQISESVSGMGLTVSMVALAMGSSSFFVFHSIALSFGIGSIIGHLAMLRFHRKGF